VTAGVASEHSVLAIWFGRIGIDRLKEHDTVEAGFSLISDMVENVRAHHDNPKEPFELAGLSPCYHLAPIVGTVDVQSRRCALATRP
jgi:hypothetical protein